MKIVVKMLVPLMSLINLVLGSPNSLVEKQPVVQEENAVYSAVIKTVFPDENFLGKPIKVLVIEDQSRIDDYKGQQVVVSDLQRRVLGLRQDTLDDFLAKNKQRHTHSISKLPFDHQFVNDDLVKSVIAYGEWRSFYEKYAGCPGLISLSKAGFNQTMIQALVYIAFAHSEDGGSGKLVLLEKTSEGWKAKRVETEWVWVG